MSDLDRLYLLLRFARALERAELHDADLRAWFNKTLRSLARKLASQEVQS